MAECEALRATQHGCDCRVLGLPPEASFEEVQDARNFLYEVAGLTPCRACTAVHV